MNLINQIFPKYKSKAQLRNEIAYLQGVHAPCIVRVERDVQKCCSCTRIDGFGSPPVDYLKRQVARQLAEFIEPFIEYDVRDMPSSPDKELVGTIYLAIGGNKK